MKTISLTADEVRTILCDHPKGRVSTVALRLSRWLEAQEASEPSTSSTELQQMQADYGCGAGGLTASDVVKHLDQIV